MRVILFRDAIIDSDKSISYIHLKNEYPFGVYFKFSYIFLFLLSNHVGLLIVIV
ncbi:hypothetical protein EZS27_018225 [termite gut metagenome]|uniref:Uncharacterized protein n=1 Tax=termite gut metagenome TaxID=433724 RepID=A0A5J4RJ11_9ZZZZ